MFIHASTDKTPFEVVEGYPKVSPILRTKNKIFATDEYVRDVHQVFTKVKKALQMAQMNTMIGYCLNSLKLGSSTRLVQIGTDTLLATQSFMQSWLANRYF